MKRAFTLIELLVVIAIIAILAAILFPVFAQAKASAKASASISNTKQITLAFLQYNADYDDTAVLSQKYDQTRQTEMSALVAGNWITLWTVLVQPYMKNLDVQTDPAGPRWRIRTERSWSALQSQSIMPGFGYNSTTWCPFPTTWPWVDYKPLSTTAIEKPAETVLVTASMVQYVDSQFGFYWVLGTRTGWISWGNIDSPACGEVFDNFCGGGWGNNFNWGGLIVSQNDDTNGYRSGGVSMRVARQGVFGFGDGHVKRMPLTRAAAGTNWTPDIDNWSVRVTDASAYLWDAK